MPLSYYTIFTASWSDPDGAWTLTAKRLLSSSPSTISAEVVVEPEAGIEPTLAYLDPENIGHGEACVKSRFECVLLDVGGDLRTVLAALEDDVELQISLSGPSSKAWTGFLDVESISPSLFTSIGLTAFNILAYDGLAAIPTDRIQGLTGFEPLALTGFNPAQLVNSVVRSINAQDVLFVLPWVCSNWRDYGGSGAFAGEFFMVPCDPNKSSNASLLTQFLQLFDARLWMDKSGEWRICTRLAIGQAVTAASGYLSESSGSTASVPAGNLSADTLALTDADIVDAAVIPYERRPGSADPELVFHSPDEINLVRDGGFEYWRSGNPVYWTETGVVEETTVVRTGNSSAKLPNTGATLEQSIAWVREGDEVYIYYSFYIYRASIGAVKYRLMIEAYDTTNDSDHYTNSSNEWTTTDAYVSQTGSAVTWTQITGTVQQRIPVTGLLKIQFEDGVTYYLDDVEVEPRKANADEVDTLGSDFMRLDANDDRAPGDAYVTTFESMEQSVDVGDSTSSVPRMWVESGDGTIEEWPVAGWTDHDSSDHPLLLGLMAQNQLARLTARAGRFQGMIFGYAYPERALTYGGNTYIMGAGVRLYLATKRSKGVWYQKYDELP